jgi:cell division protein FtsB
MIRSLVGGDMTSPRASVNTQRLGGGYKLLAGIALTMGVVMVLVILFSHRGLYQIYRLRHERLRLDQENARLAAENARLARTIDRLHHDPVLIQDLIRKELNFVKKDEIIFQFPPEKPETAPELADTNNGEAPPPARVHALSARTVGNSQWVCPPPQRSAKKGAGPRGQ